MPILVLSRGQHPLYSPSAHLEGGAESRARSLCRGIQNHSHSDRVRGSFGLTLMSLQFDSHLALSRNIVGTILNRCRVHFFLRSSLLPAVVTNIRSSARDLELRCHLLTSQYQCPPLLSFKTTEAYLMFNCSRCQLIIYKARWWLSSFGLLN